MVVSFVVSVVKVSMVVAPAVEVDVVVGSVDATSIFEVVVVGCCVVLVAALVRKTEFIKLLLTFLPLCTILKLINLQ